MDQESDLSYFYIESQQQQDSDNYLITILDCSGSMSSYWKYVANNYNNILQVTKKTVTITFDTNVKVFTNNEQISTSINQYGGGGTDITKPFVKLNQVLNDLQIKENVTILFVSDGQGSYDEKEIRKNFNHIKNLNFICIGVGNNFPTRISMDLRALYHTGNLAIPSIFIIDVNSDCQKMNRLEYLEKIFFEEFQSVGQIIKPSKILNISPCYQFPWDQQKKEQISSGTWVCSYENQLQLEDQVLQPVKLTNASISQLGTFWLQNIKILSMKQQVTDIAKIAHAELLKIIQKNIPKVKQQGKKTVAQRLEQNQNIKSDLEILTEELKEFANSFTLQSLNDKDAADRLKIGSKVGKFHQKSLKFAGQTVEDFEKAKKEFLECLKEHKFDGDDGDRSLLTLQSQKEILQEEDLKIGLQNCFSQYALVTAFPIIGYGLYIHRSDASRIDPYKISVVSLVRIHKFIDSVSLIEANDHTLEFKIGDDEIEKVNCILPLYTKEKNQDLIPFFRSQLFHTIMTFVVCESADICYDFSYSALLANTLYFLIQQPNSEWKSEMIQLIIESYQLAYDKKHGTFNQKFVQNPSQALVDMNKDNDTICQDTLRGILALASLQKNLDQEKIKEITNCIILESVGRCLKDLHNKDLINFFFKLDQQANVLNKLEQEVLDYFDDEALSKCKSMSQINSALTEQVKAISQNQWQLENFFNQDQVLKALSKTKFKYQSLQNIYEYFLQQEIPHNLFIAIVFHARFVKSLERAQKPVIFDMEKITEEVTKLKIAQLQEVLNEMCKAKIRDVIQQKGISKLFVQRMPGFGISRRRRRRPNVQKVKQ